MTILAAICALLTLGYTLLMGLYCMGWLKAQGYSVPAGYVPHTTVSIVIPARNEAANIAACINAVLQQQYPMHMLEVVVVDDHSEDDTAAIVQAYSDERVRYVSLAAHLPAGQTMAYKKAALTVGIAQSRGSLIITTDADCVAGPQWVRYMAAMHEQQGAVMVVAPVVYSYSGSLLQAFQGIDFMSMQGITAAAQRLQLGGMCNGANLAFSRVAFDTVGGYAGVDYLASGDDYLLLMKMKRLHAGSIAYIKAREAIVTTAPQPDWKGFLQQRVRWASKSGKYNDGRLTAILLLVYLFNASFAVLVVAGVVWPGLLVLLAAMLAVKTMAEFVFLVPVARFFGRSRLLWWFPFLQPLHIIYIITAGLMGFAGGYEWKGRAVR